MAVHWPLPTCRGERFGMDALDERTPLSKGCAGDLIRTIVDLKNIRMPRAILSAIVSLVSWLGVRAGAPKSGQFGIDFTWRWVFFQKQPAFTLCAHIMVGKINGISF